MQIASKQRRTRYKRRIDIMRHRMSWTNLKYYLRRHLLHSHMSLTRKSASVALGLLLGMLPIWGAQGIAAITAAHIARLSKSTAFIFTRISIPPIAPFIILGEYAVGCLLTGEPMLVNDADSIVRETITHLWQYIFGSIVCAVAVAAVGFVLTYGILWLLARRRTTTQQA